MMKAFSINKGLVRMQARRFVSLLVLLSFCLYGQAQGVVKGLVVDAETDEPLPFARVWVSSDLNTITNAEGEFQLATDQVVEIQISYTGYSTQKVKSNKLKDKVRLKPFTRMMNEVVVRGFNLNKMMERITKQLAEDYKQHKKERAPYFFRTVFSDGLQSRMVEAFLTARSAVNVREMAIISGIDNADAVTDIVSLPISVTNIHRTAELGARTHDTDRWSKCIKPFDDAKVWKKYYTTTYELLGEGDSTIAKVNFSPAKPTKKQILTGTAYIRLKDSRLLRFSGKALNQILQSGLARMRDDVSFSMEYDYESGHAEIAHIALEGGGKSRPNRLSSLSQIQYHVQLFRLHQDSLLSAPCTPMREELMRTLQHARYNPELWRAYEMVRRTPKEERLLYGASPVEDLPYMDETTNDKLVRLVNHQRRFASSIPQEKVYIHMDNTSYCLGDTIWFAAYTRSSNNDRPSEISNVLYVELLNNDGYLVERKLIRLQHGHGSGYFALDNGFSYSGYYELRAYTRWQLNWGAYEKKHSLASKRWFISDELEHNYFRDYEKLYSRVFPVFDKPEEPGVLGHQMTLRPLRRPSYNTPKKSKLKLTLYPEGGNLVEGLPCRVAFEALRDDGEWAEGSIAEPASPAVNRGRGVFEITPEQGASRTVTFVASDGETVKAKLPKPLSSGGVLRVNHTGKDWQLDVRLTPDIAPQSTGLVITREGHLHAFFAPKQTTNTFMFEAPAASGVYQATLFDEEGRVLADRLFFHRAEGVGTSLLTVEGLKSTYEPYEAISLAIKKEQGTPSTFTSLAVRDAAASSLGNHDTGNILTEMLLASEIRGFVPDPNWFFQSDDEAHRQALDLLMMTQGWRRFDWSEMATSENWTPKQPRETQPIIAGRVYKANEADPRLYILQEEANVLYTIEGQPIPVYYVASAKKHQDEQGGRQYVLHAQAKGVKGIYSLQDAITAKDGTFQREIPNFYGSCMLFLAATPKEDYNPELTYVWEEMSDPEYLTPLQLARSEIAPSKHLVLIDPPYPRFVQPYNHYQKQVTFSSLPADSSLYAEEDVHVIKEVTVDSKFKGQYRFTDRYPAFVLDNMEALNATIDAGMYYTSNAQLKTALGDMGLEVFPPTSMGEETLGSAILSHGQKDGITFGIRHRLGASPSRQVLMGSATNTDSIQYLASLNSLPTGAFISENDAREYLGLGAIERSVYYTDYSPRYYGDERYANDFPEVNIVHYPHENGGPYPVYTDRCLLWNGFALPAKFYSPDYSQRPLPEQKDYRRTLYWNPNLRLDENGEAHITLYNNSRHTTLEVDAQGQAADGTLLYNR